MQFQKKSISTSWKVIRNSKVEGGLKSQNLEFRILGDGGFKTKNLP